uniref:Cas12f1-like TNB domain-containing protein n=1 Tax=viral metagenome TaxID=1070528 RepID=A0A6C0C7T5_9ZZZZ
MDGDTNIVVCKNKLSNIIKENPNELVIKNEYSDFNRKKILEVLNDAVIRTNKIVFHTYNFLKLYILHLFDSGEKFPVIDKDFVYSIMTLLAERTEKSGRKPSIDKLKIIDKLTQFYNKFYVHLVCQDDLICDDKLSYILKNYECVDIVKNINNNIKEHFPNHVRKYVNLLFKVKDKKLSITNSAILTPNQKKEELRKINERYNNIKYDILSTDPEFKSDMRDFHKFLWIRNLILPYDTFVKNNVIYDLKVNPQNYLKSMITLNNLIQNLNEDRCADYKLFHVLPLRTSIVPRYITIDTATIVSLFIGKAEYFKNITDLSDDIWRSIFNLDDGSFKRKNHKFIHMIKTDGIACSILLEKKKKEERKVVKVSPIPLLVNFEKSNNVASLKTGIKRKVHNREKNEDEKYNYEYIEDATLTKGQKNMNFVFIDPGHNDLIKCLSTNFFRKRIDEIAYVDGFENVPKDKTFRYTRKQRNRESKKMRNRKIMSNIKTEDIMKKEAKLSDFNSKTCNFKKFSEYLAAKIKLNRELYDHYEQEIYRKLKFNVYTNTRKSESKMINNFKEKMGKPNDTIIVFGDYSKEGTMKGSEPHISKRLKKVFVQNKYKLYEINEYNTSKLCNKCSCVTENIEKSGSKIWKLLRCTSEKCLTYHDRDLNAVRNMKKIVSHVISGKGRPREYTNINKTSAL